jgi:flagellar hook protein FlgE
VYDSKGATHTVSVQFENISTDSLTNTWSWEASVDNGDIIPTAGNKGTLRFNTNGSLAVFTIGDGQALTFDPGGGANTMQITLDAGDAGTFSGITQLYAPTTTVAKHQDGYGMGNLQTISIDETGEITGHFSNGVSQILAQVVLAEFNNPGGLLRAGDNMYKSSANSGTPVKGTVGGGIEASIASGSLEMSNVDLAQEFTDMIVAQRGFQANARVISTADTLLDEIVRLKR